MDANVLLYHFLPFWITRGQFLFSEFPIPVITSKGTNSRPEQKENPPCFNVTEALPAHSWWLWLFPALFNSILQLGLKTSLQTRLYRIKKFHLLAVTLFPLQATDWNSSPMVSRGGWRRQLFIKAVLTSFLFYLALQHWNLLSFNLINFLSLKPG